MFKAALFNWKTTVGGVIGILSGLGLLGVALRHAIDGQPSWQEFTAAFGAIGLGWAGLVAKDGDKTGLAPSSSPPRGFALPVVLVIVAVCSATVVLACAGWKGATVTTNAGCACVATQPKPVSSTLECGSRCVPTADPNCPDEQAYCQQIGQPMTAFKLAAPAR